MARKKKYKDGELEQEFKKAVFQHMYITIRSSLIAFPEEDILNSDLVLTLLGNIKGSKETRIAKLCASIVELHDTGHDADIVPLYEYCWSLLSPRLTDNISDSFRYSDL